MYLGLFFTPLHSATYDTSISMGNRDKRNDGLYNPPPSHEAAGWLPRAVSEPAHPSGRRELRPLPERHGGGAELRQTRCPGATQPGVPGQPRAAALLAVTALRRLITPAARLPLALLLQQPAEWPLRGPGGPPRRDRLPQARPRSAAASERTAAARGGHEPERRSAPARVGGGCPELRRAPRREQASYRS